MGDDVVVVDLGHDLRRRGSTVWGIRASCLLFGCRPLVGEPGIDSLRFPEKEKMDKSRCETLLFVCEMEVMDNSADRMKNLWRMKEKEARRAERRWDIHV